MKSAISSKKIFRIISSSPAETAIGSTTPCIRGPVSRSSPVGRPATSTPAAHQGSIPTITSSTGSKEASCRSMRAARKARALFLSGSTASTARWSTPTTVRGPLLNNKRNSGQLTPLPPAGRMSSSGERFNEPIPYTDWDFYRDPNSRATTAVAEGAPAGRR